MKPETIKAIAEALGYEVKISSNNPFNPVWTIGKEGAPSKAFKLDDPAIQMEIIGYLLKHEWDLCHPIYPDAFRLFKRVTAGKNPIVNDESLSQCIINAMCKQIGE